MPSAFTDSVNQITDDTWILRFETVLTPLMCRNDNTRQDQKVMNRIKSLLVGMPCTSVHFFSGWLCAPSLSLKYVLKCYPTPKCSPLTPSLQERCVSPAVNQTGWGLTSSARRSRSFWIISVSASVEQKNYPSMHDVKLVIYFSIFTSINHSFRNITDTIYTVPYTVHNNGIIQIRLMRKNIFCFSFHSVSLEDACFWLAGRLKGVLVSQISYGATIWMTTKLQCYAPLSQLLLN